LNYNGRESHAMVGPRKPRNDIYGIGRVYSMSINFGVTNDFHMV
jgi:hypothetical protein